MWDNPRLLNSVAGTLTGIALLLLAFAAAQLLLRSRLFPVHEITVRGKLAHTTPEQIAQAARGHIDGNFFAVDLGEVRDALQQLPWVRSVSVRRLWPDRLEVRLEEHVPLAHWGTDALVDGDGERFAAQSNAPLPILIGPDGTEAQVTQRFRSFAALLAPLGKKPLRVELTPRYAWRLWLDDGLQVALGRDTADHPVDARLARFVAVYAETLGKMGQRLAYVDLRYPNGFALREAGSKG
ncbi:MAG TPA: cell division protein FtsQ/DivIB [Burkholderiales bacterium]|nr:cell division protein FtsQ/DivIB [Burkholderiales bacterium]